MISRNKIVGTALLACVLIAQAATARTWTDVTGKFTIEADLVAVEGEQVRLKKTDGTIVTLPINKLSLADRRFLQAPESTALWTAHSMPLRAAW